MAPDDTPALAVTPNDMAVASELAVLVALDAVLAAAAYQLFVANPDVGIDAFARCYGSLPDPTARKASFLIMHISELRTALRSYRNLALHEDPDDHSSF
jgi:hypothetical protein